MNLAARQLQAVQQRLTATTPAVENDTMANTVAKEMQGLVIDPSAQQQQRAKHAEAPASPKSGVTLGAFLAGGAGIRDSRLPRPRQMIGIVDSGRMYVTI